MNLERIELMEVFQKKLDTNPPKEAICKMERENYFYLPISYYYTTLNDIYFGQWKVKDFKTEFFLNEFIASLQLHVLHPISDIWIIRQGIAAIPITQDSGAAITDMSKKKRNSLQKNCPTATAIAIKNAAKSLGKIFGSDLNKDRDKIHHNKNIVDGAKLQNLLQEISDKRFNKMIEAISKGEYSADEALKIFSFSENQLQKLNHYKN